MIIVINRLLITLKILTNNKEKFNCAQIIVYLTRHGKSFSEITIHAIC